MSWYPGKFIGGLRPGHQEEEEVAGETAPTIAEQQAEFRAYWASQGVDGRIVENAIKLADEWAGSLAQFTSNGDPKIYEAVKRNIYPKALNTVAGNWIRSLLD